MNIEEEKSQHSLVEAKKQPKLMLTSKHAGMINGVRFNAYQTMLITYGSDGQLHLYEYNQSKNQWKLVCIHQAHGSAILCAEWCHPAFGSRIATGSFDGLIKIHKLASNKTLITEYSSKKFQYPIFSLAWCKQTGRFGANVGYTDIKIFWRQNDIYKVAEYCEKQPKLSSIQFIEKGNFICAYNQSIQEFELIKTEAKIVKKIQQNQSYNFSEIKNDSEIRQILWQRQNSLEITRLIILTQSSLSILEAEDKQFSLNFKANESKNTSISFSSSNTCQILAYAYENKQIVTRVYRQCMDGSWIIDKNEQQKSIQLS